MRVDWNKKYCGLSAKNMRKFLIHLRSFSLYDKKRRKEDVLRYYEMFKLIPRLSKINFIKSLIEEGFIEKEKQHYMIDQNRVFVPIRKSLAAFFLPTQFIYYVHVF